MKRFPGLIATIELALLICFGNALADHIVLHSESTNFTAGQILHDPLTISLKSGERIVLLSDRGDVMDIVGPFDGSPAVQGADDFDVKDALSRLIDNPNNLHASLGGTRSGATLPSTSVAGLVWSLDPYSSGVQCAIEGQELAFGRSDTESALVLHVERPGRDGTGVVNFGSNSTRAVWPGNIPVTDGELYVVRREGYLDSAMFRLALLPAIVAGNIEASIAWLATYGCARQATLLLSELPD